MKHILTALLALTALPAMAGHELQDRDLPAGAALYGEHCASCHGAKLEGQPDWRSPDENGVLPAPPHDRTGHTWHHSNAQLFEYTALGGAEIGRRLKLDGFQSGMPGFAQTLTEDQIWDVLAYIASTWPPREAAIQAARNLPH